jgi:RNA polymerase sigma factor (TIGR02999 family)
VLRLAEQEITRLLQNWVAGDSASLDRLTPMVYQHLHKIAANAFRGERADHTLQTTALVHEAYAKLVDIDIDWQDRSHFFALAARLMRRILVDHAKSKSAKRRGEGGKALPLDDVIVVTPEVGDEILDLHEALNQLAERDPRKAEMLELQFFGGLTYEEMSEVLNLSRSTLDRDLRFAKAWLGNQLKKNNE